MNRQPSRPGPLSSPLVTGTLGIVLVALVAIALVVSGAWPGASPGPSASGTPIASSSPGGSPTGSALPSVGPSPSPSFVLPTPTPEPTFTTYVVRPGDTLFSIARDFSTTARSIAWWNRGTYPSLDPESDGYDPGHIEIGWVFAILPGAVVDDLKPPTPSPGPPTPTPGATVAPTSGPTAPPTATPAPAAAAIVISHGTRGTSKVALTFDMGGRLDPAIDIVTWLAAHDIHATIFPTGKTGSETTIGRDALELAASHPGLFDFGNHSWSHPYFTSLTAAQRKAQLVSTENAIAPLVGTSTKPWFRPPYGAQNAAVRAGVGAAGWAYLVMWDVDTIDWKAVKDGGPTTAQIVSKVVDNAQGGSIVLMHLGGYNTLDALPGIISGLQAKGLQPVTLGEMFGR